MDRKKLMYLVFIIAIVIVVIAIGVIVMRKSSLDEEAYDLSASTIEAPHAHGELIGSAKSEEDANRIAELYGIRLIDYSYGMALYETIDGEDELEVIKRGKENGYPELSLNYSGTFD